MQKGLKTLGIRGLIMTQDTPRVGNTLNTILKSFNIRFAGAIAVLALGFGAGIGYASTTEKYSTIQISLGRSVEVQEKHNDVLGTYDCSIVVQFPKPGEVVRIDDYGCDHSIDHVKLHGVRSNVPYHRLSSEDQSTSTRILDDITYKLKP
ncbi:hypothetical protein HOD05_02805 [Candidatus Woesearchaeota archaeon]|jgi:hypothetical protein|nr:hypothetical protein [Candidatus Woesearchaeota archaeon]MBT4151302.1 hypothetical protein [Candidatus Woesearchaeota archaeon]MBT4247461.1 hypothetical protein [Candidatus Woesearchaeota archaeon]MBT4434124.1 hypothetical protein [Candidatus Woesearchaeota archaeon]MBT7331775.1 hypothetical protein [Candidatus Woesearchaeota archaeon]